MRLVKEYDPYGERTIGVLTKLDLMDKGTDARGVLNNSDVYLKHGWIGVVNRSQADINKRVNSQVARERERAYFKASKTYQGLTTGTDSLVNNLTTHLETCITKALPKIQQHLDSTLRSMEKELATFAEMPPDRSSKMAVVLELVRPA
jgi:dynamin 1-like protein